LKEGVHSENYFLTQRTQRNHKAHKDKILIIFKLCSLRKTLWTLCLDLLTFRNGLKKVYLA